ncbi:MAG: helix-turn-helix transcriptional regulator [Nitrosopumilus sp.]|nr:helix-turn-helix transcriptional regulator [Nitrosopumilus sp.]
MNKNEENGIICLCPLEGIIDLVGKKWSLLIINEIGNHNKIRYNELKEELSGISPKTLSDMLKELYKNGLINKEIHNEIPTRVEYTLTNDGVELRKSIIPLLKWATLKKGTVIANCSCSIIENGKRIS